MRIAKAVREDRWNKAKALQWLLTHSFYAKVLAIRRVTENRGKNTVGVDGEKWSTPKAKFKAIVRLKRRGYQPKPVRRVYIPKAKGKRRPLGIPCMVDRAMKSLHLLGLEPIAETHADKNSYGFRPERGTADAIGQCFNLLCKNDSAQWVLEGDIKSCYDEIDHRLLRRFLKKRIQDERLLDLITRMLRCGIQENGGIIYPSKGTPQGAVCSPLLANVFLHEFDDWFWRTYRQRPEWEHLSSSSLQYRRKKEVGGTVMLTRYADDWVVTWNGSRDRAEEIKADIKTFLANHLKLRLSEDKTLITHVDDGFIFLGYSMIGNKRWTDGRWCLFSRVPQSAIRRFRDAVKSITTSTYTDEVAAFTALSSLIRGWGNYYAYAAESRLMDSLDAFIYHQLWKYCCNKHLKVGKKVIFSMYTLPRPLRTVGFFHIGLVVGDRVIRIPRLSSIPSQIPASALSTSPLPCERTGLHPTLSQYG